MDHLGVFAKYWTPGKVKTRLAATIGENVSADVYREMLTYLIENLQSVGDLRTIAFTPMESQDQFAKLAQSVIPSTPKTGDTAWQLAAQVEGSLGNRMTHFFESTFSDSSTRNVVLIGSDCPTITPKVCDEAFTMLKTNDVVLGPTFDGGYYLVGMSERYFDVFSGITYSTESVFDQTLTKMKQDNIKFSLLPPLQDIDEYPQLVDLRKALANDCQPQQRKLLNALESALAEEGTS